MRDPKRSTGAFRTNFDHRPGAVAGRDLLAERHGRLGLEECLRDAVLLAREGFAVGPRCAPSWAAAPVLPSGLGPAPERGKRVQLPELGRTLGASSAAGASAFYEGAIGEAIVLRAGSTNGT